MNKQRMKYLLAHPVWQTICRHCKESVRIRYFRKTKQLKGKCSRCGEMFRSMPNV